ALVARHVHGPELPHAEPLALPPDPLLCEQDRAGAVQADQKDRDEQKGSQQQQDNGRDQDVDEAGDQRIQVDGSRKEPERGAEGSPYLLQLHQAVIAVPVRPEDGAMAQYMQSTLSSEVPSTDGTNARVVL